MGESEESEISYFCSTKVLKRSESILFRRIIQKQSMIKKIIIKNKQIENLSYNLAYSRLNIL